MRTETRSGSAALAAFVTAAVPPAAARARAAAAFQDTIGVILAGVSEPAARMAQAMAPGDSRGECRVLGTNLLTNASDAALANGVAAHALDYDDMCFVSLAHPSCALVPAILAAGELANAPGTALTAAYVVGFEIECRLGMAMNPRHYHERGWHATSSIGTLGAAAASAHVLGLGETAARHALGIAASAACGFKENMGSMVKPLHAGLAARSGLMAARLAMQGFTASERALDGPQGYLAVMDAEQPSLDGVAADLGSRWEILESGITVKLYPSCAATHPPLDALLDLRRELAFTPAHIESIDVQVDSMTPRLLMYDRPATGLEGKFSMPFCAAAAIVFGRVGIDTFEPPVLQNPRVRELMPRVTMRVSTAFDAAAPLSQAEVTLTLRDGRVLRRRADGARGYPGRLSNDELAAKFGACARRALSAERADLTWSALQQIDDIASARALTGLMAG